MTAGHITGQIELEPEVVEVHLTPEPIVVDMVAEPIEIHLAPETVEISLEPEPIVIELAATGVPGAPGRDGVDGQPGPPGPPGAQGVTVEAATDLPAYTVVKVMASGRARAASSLILGDGESATGVTTVAALAGEQVPIRTVGAVTTLVPFPIGPLYLGENGELTTDAETGEFSLRVAFAQTPTLLIVRFDAPVYSL